MNLQEKAAKNLRNACNIFLQDLQALPEEVFAKSFGAKTRTVADIVYEVNMVNDHVGMVIRGEKPFDWPEVDFVLAPADFQTKDVIIEAFKKSSEKIVSTLEGFSETQVTEPIQADGKETTRFDRCQFMVLHMWYHSGQLNFIQTMLGDDGWHWSF
jgi:uncharacterized damage-inducible protein DinB